MPFPDVIALLRAYLTPLVDPVPVVSTITDPRPDQVVQLRRIGGSTATVRDLARVDIWCWALTAEEAMTLALGVRGAVWALSGTDVLGVVCYRIAEFLGPRQQDDPLTATPRVWATYQLDVRADEAVKSSLI